MKLINCIAGVIMSRTAVVFSDEIENFWGEYVELKKFCDSITVDAYRECMLSDKARRYEYITNVILNGNAIAQNVLDLTIAQMLFPAFGALLRKYTGYGANIENACRLQGYGGKYELSASIDEMYIAYKLLSQLYDTGESASFFQTEHFCDNRILAFINGKDDCFEPKGVTLCLASDYIYGDYDVPFNIDKYPFGIVARLEMECVKMAYTYMAGLGKNMVCFDVGLVDNNMLEKSVRKAAREAIFYDACIFVIGISDKNCITIVRFLKDNLSKYDIEWGLGLVKDILQVIRRLDIEELELYYDKNLKKIGEIEAPSGMLVDPDKYITMDELIIPEKQKELLNRICNHVKYENRVYSEWGMDSKYRYGKGTPVLFAGPPGTGKTMAAHVLSNLLDIPLYKIDLSQVADKYIGETEKHLRKVFDFADENKTLLFFDEADSLFGKRSEVKESKDRYANMEISYILQRIEQFDGVAILATNLRENMDSAFIRRMKYIVDFQMPDKDMREQIWRNGFSTDVPKDDIDYDFLASQFELSGGNIKNIILTATFLAAGRNEKVGMLHIFESVENEYYKYSKKMSVEDFGKYGYILL